ncbi:MAG TPA: MarR family transcriptional regulator, partial [Ruania sp.]|nr:MarR family transcriptional regulator [Ruania sp.]
MRPMHPHHHEPPGPDADLSELLMHAARQMRRSWAHSIHQWGLSPHQAIALRTADAEEGGRVSDLARRLRIAPRSATEVVDSLEERGLVRRSPCPEDRRAVLVEVTEDGREMARQIERARADARAAVFDRLTSSEQQELRHLLRR